jgi:hypothetical protein
VRKQAFCVFGMDHHIMGIEVDFIIVC